MQRTRVFGLTFDLKRYTDTSIFFTTNEVNGPLWVIMDKKKTMPSIEINDHQNTKSI